MARSSSGSLRRLACWWVAVLVAAALPAQDVFEVGWVSGEPGQIVDVPVHVRDRGGTLLNEGDGFNLEIQGFAFRVDFLPADSVAALDFIQDGVTAGKTPVLPVIEAHDSYIYVLISFSEATDPLDFTLDLSAPGDLIGQLRLELAPDAPEGLNIALVVQPATATLVNHDATLEETLSNGHLAIVSGVLTVTGSIFADDFETGDLSLWSGSVP